MPRAKKDAIVGKKETIVEDKEKETVEAEKEKEIVETEAGNKTIPVETEEENKEIPAETEKENENGENGDKEETPETPEQNNPEQEEETDTEVDSDEITVEENEGTKFYTVILATPTYYVISKNGTNVVIHKQNKYRRGDTVKY